MTLERRYTSRGGLQPDDPTFVGRRDVLDDLLHRMNGASRVNSVVVLGPKRSGKTSLLRQLTSPRVRAEYGPEVATWCVGFVDLSNRPRDFDALRRRLVEAAAQALQRRFDPELLTRVDYLEGQLEHLLDGATAPLVLLVDEFDAAAPDLRRDDLGELRAAACNLPSFAFAFTAERDPSQSIEDTKDKMSDLLAVLHCVPARLGALSEGEARALVQLGRTSHELAPDPAAERHVVELVGRHPLLLQAACFEWYSVAKTRVLAELDPAELQRADERIARAYTDQCGHVVSALHPATIAALSNGPLAGEGAAELAALGLQGPLFERFLQTSLRGMSPAGRVDALLVSLERLRLQRHGDKYPIIIARNDHVYLRRRVTDNRDAAAFAASLSRLLSAYRPFLPDACLRDPDGPVGRIVRGSRPDVSAGEAPADWCERQIDELERQIHSALDGTAEESTPEPPAVPRRAGNLRFVVITIKTEEFDAVLERLRRLPKCRQEARVEGGNTYEVFQLLNLRGESIEVAVARCLKQGNLEAQRVTSRAIEALRPNCILVTGIAGATPTADLTLGDVVVSDQIVDLRVSAVAPDGSRTFAVEAPRVDERLESWLANLSARRRDDLRDWNASKLLAKRPPVVLTDDRFTAEDPELRQRTRGALSAEFGPETRERRPKFVVGTLAATDTLIKDLRLLDDMRHGARQIIAVDMESAGAFAAARAAGTAILAVRGISDVVGFRRDEAWTRYACNSAAAFTCALLRMSWPS